MKRYHSLDALRAVMMLLGLVLHSAASYTARSLGVAWPYQDRDTSPLFDLAFYFIHLFRMPVFFVLAGFFGALLFQRAGGPGLLRNRRGRVLVPFVIAWVATFPLASAGFAFVKAGKMPAGVPWWAFITSGRFLRPPHLIHLWFLYYLMIFYVVAIAVVPLTRRVPLPLRRAVEAGFRKLAGHRAGILAFSLLTALTLWPMSTPGLDISTSFVPPLRLLAAYGVFFVFGWLAYRRLDVAQTFVRVPLHITGGLVISLAYLYVLLRPPFASRPMRHGVGVIAASLATWLLIFGITGLFVRLFERPSPMVRYMSDASYWMYLAHLPLAIWIPGLLSGQALPAPVKFAIVLGATLAITLSTYWAFVRSTAIGALLNGRRHPRSLLRRATPAPSG